MMTKDQPPKTVTSAVMTALSRPSLLKGALVSVALFFSVYLLPIPGFFLYAFTPVPLVYYYYHGGRLFGLTMMAAAAVGVFILFTFLGNGVEGLTFLVHVGLALAIGEGISQRLNPGKIVTWAAVAFLGMTLFVITLDGLSQGMGPVTYIKTYMGEHVRFYLDAYGNIDPAGREILETDNRNASDATRWTPSGDSPSDSGSLDISRETTDRQPSRTTPESLATAKWVQIMLRITPGSLVVGALLIAWANFMIVRLLLVRTTGLPPELVQLREWRAPERLVWPVIACGFIIFLPLGMLRIVAANGLLVLWLIYFFQGLSIISFWLNKKSVPSLIRTFIYLAIFLQPFLYLVVAMAGFFDLWFDFRKLKNEDAGPA